MKQLLPIIAVAGIMVLGACKEKKQTQDIITTKLEVQRPQAPISMQEYRQETDTTWQGQKYHITIIRTPDNSLPMVKDEIGQEFVDNRISLVVMRQDSTVFFKKEFLKGSFNVYLDDDYRRNGILEALIFDKVDNDKLDFAVSVAHPQSEDEFIPLEMTLDRNGGLTIRRDDDIDTNGNDENNDV